MINREIKVGDRLRWIDPGRKVRDEVFTVARIDGDYVYDTRDKVYRVLGSTYPHNYEHVNEPQADPVNHPPHYTQGDIECIDAIRSALGRDGFIAFCVGNNIKYSWRYRHKGGVEDLKKAEWYINRANEEAVE
jgi:hypothetical protein